MQRVFVTSLSYAPASMGSVSGADKKCTIAAEAAAIGGTWMAWLSDETTDAIDRVVGTGPWYLLHGVTKVFNNRANLATNALGPIAMTESGAYVSNDVYTRTGTVVGGTRSGKTCGSWSTTVGTGGLGNGRYGDFWTESDFGPSPCTAGFRLFCFEE